MFLEQIKRCIKREQLAEADTHIYVAVSGGADSVALLTALYLLGYDLEIIHCNFHLRSTESDADEAFVHNCAERLNLKIQSKHFDTRHYAKNAGLSIEMAARQLRYTWFESILSENPGARIALGHHADDAVETCLYNMAQGTGIRGLVGIPYKRSGGIIRPMLDCTRSEVLNFLRTNPYINTWREDSSNKDTKYRRNYIRHDLLPCFDELKPNASRQIQQTINQLRGVEAFYRESIARYKDLVLCPRGINIKTLLASPAPETLLFEIISAYGFSSHQCHQIARGLSRLNCGSAYLSQTHRLIRSSQYLEILPLEHPDLEPLILDYTQLPQEVTYGRQCLHLSLATAEHLTDGQSLYLPLERLEGKKLYLRRLKTGDRMSPFGMKRGSKRLSRILIDAKVPHGAREQAIILCLEEQILWLIPWCKSELSRLNPKDLTKACLKISLRPLATDR